MSVFRFEAIGTSTPVSRKNRGNTTTSSNTPSKSPSFAFSVSPSILQETLDRSEVDARSATGLTMKDYDDQLKKLTAENFNLRLKIYFLDQRITKMDGVSGSCDIIKENVELKVENEKLTAEVSRQSKLLSDSLDAFEGLKTGYEKNVSELKSKFAAEKKELELRAGALEARLHLMNNLSQASSLEDINCTDLTTCKEEIRRLQNKFQESRNQVEFLESSEAQLRCRVKELEEALEQQKDKSAEKEKLLERITELQEKLESNQVADDSEVVAELKRKLEQESKDANILMNEKFYFQDRVTALESELQSHKALLLQRNEEINVFKAQVVEYEKQIELLANVGPIGDCLSKSDEEKLKEELRNKEIEISKLTDDKEKAMDTIKSFMKRVLDEKRTVRDLQQQLSKEKALVAELKNARCGESLEAKTDAADLHCSCGLQERVSKIQQVENELITINAKLASEKTEALSAELLEKKNEIERLNSDLKKRTNYLQQLVNKELWEKNRAIEKLERRLRAEDAETLKLQLKELANERAELRKEVAALEERERPLREACQVLTEQLEELVEFLDSLLTNRVDLTCEERSAIMMALDRSREVSKRINGTFNDVSGFTNSFMSKSRPLTASITSESFELLQQIAMEPPPFELDKDDFNLDDTQWLELRLSEFDLQRSKSSKKTKSISVAKEDASESEAWSEPDRSVSLARMGHVDVAQPPKCKGSSEEETLHEPRSHGKRGRSSEESKKLSARVKQLEDINRELQVQIALLENQLFDAKTNDKVDGNSNKDVIEAWENCKKWKTELVIVRTDLLGAKEDLLSNEKLISQQKETIAKLEAANDELVMQYELQLLEVKKAQQKAEARIVDMRAELVEAENLRVSLEKNVADISQKMADAHILQSKSKEQVKEAEKHLDSCEKIIQEKSDSERKVKELQQFNECLKRSVEEKQKEMDSWIFKAKKDYEEIGELRRRLMETERSKALVEAKVKEEGERIQWMEGKLKELELAMEQCEQETQAKIGEEVKRRVENRVAGLRREWVPRVELERTCRSLEEMEGRLKKSEATIISLQESFKEKEAALAIRINKLEGERRELRLKESENGLEVTRLANERTRLETELQQAVERQNHLLRQLREAELTIRSLEKQTGDSSSNGETNGSIPSATVKDILLTRNLNSSPDLGIESDQGRFSSLEHQEQNRLMRTDVNMNKLEIENMDLKMRLAKLGQTLEETLNELATANHHKKQMERAICKQLHKTHHILKKARINFELQDSDSPDELH